MIQYIDNKCILDWGDVQKRCKEISNDIKSKYDLSKIQLVGVVRGGLIPATIIAYNLGIRLQVLDIYSYNNDKQDKIINNSNIELDWKKKYIVIDDIYDTGQTYNYIKEKYLINDFYFIIDKRDVNINKNYWYVFPWER